MLVIQQLVNGLMLGGAGAVNIYLYGIVHR